MMGWCVPGGGLTKKDCIKEETEWSRCSVTCGMGVSMRVTRNNPQCEAKQERRLCLVRPCEFNDKQLVRWMYFALNHSILGFYKFFTLRSQLSRACTAVYIDPKSRKYYLHHKNCLKVDNFYSFYNA